VNPSLQVESVSYSFHVWSQGSKRSKRQGLGTIWADRNAHVPSHRLAAGGTASVHYAIGSALLSGTTWGAESMVPAHTYAASGTPDRRKSSGHLPQSVAVLRCPPASSRRADRRPSRPQVADPRAWLFAINRSTERHRSWDSARSFRAGVGAIARPDRRRRPEFHLPLY